MKRIFALALVLVLVLAMAVPAMAAGTVSLKITHIADGHTFRAYRIFKGTLEGATLAYPDWAEGVDGTKLLDALQKDETKLYNADKSAFVTFKDLFKDAKDADDVIDILKAFSTDGVRLDRFATLAAGCVTTQYTESTPNGEKTYTFSNLEPGYYLITDVTENAKVGAEDYKTHYVLSLTTHTEVTTKGNYPTIDKSVSETLDGTYSEYIARQLELDYYFKWDVNIDNRIAEFDTYYLAFDDVMSVGMDFVKWEEVYFLQADNSKVYLYQDGAWVSTAATPNVITVDTDGGTRLNGASYTADETYIRLAWDDLKKAFPDIAGDDHLIVKYSAKLNEDAVYNKAMPNDVFIKFSNGPDDDDFGMSNPDYAFVFSFGLRIDKVDADNTALRLPGTEFLLYHKHGTENHYAVVNADDEIIAWTTYTTDAQVEAAKAAIDADDSLTAEQKTAAKAKVFKASTLVTDENGKIVVYGLDEDIQYSLHETKAPTGYNTMFTDVNFTISPVYETVSGVPQVKELHYSVDGHDYVLTEGDDFTAGRVVVTVVNDKGNTLPSTGGIGTTLFYLFGSLMFAGAAVLLVTKKRMAA